MQKFKSMLERFPSRTLPRVARGYWTISTEAIQALTDLPPVFRLVDERERLFKSETGHLASVKSRKRQITLRTWQVKWNNLEKCAAWTKILIPDLSAWVQHGYVAYHLIKFISSHGNFCSCRIRLIITTDEECVYRTVGTPEHTVLECNKWTRNRREMTTGLDQEIDKKNGVQIMIQSETNWKKYKNS